MAKAIRVFGLIVLGIGVYLLAYEWLQKNGPSIKSWLVYTKNNEKNMTGVVLERLKEVVKNDIIAPKVRDLKRRLGWN